MDYWIPFAKVRQFWADLTGYGYNPATLVSVQTTLHEELVPVEEQIKAHLKAAEVCHFDETEVRVGRQLQWLHVASTADCTYLFVHPKRGRGALLCPQSIFMDCQSWIIHDCWASYFTVDKGRHALCGVHLLRELVALTEQGSAWAKAMHTYLLEAYKASRYGPILAAEGFTGVLATSSFVGRPTRKNVYRWCFSKRTVEVAAPSAAKGATY